MANSFNKGRVYIDTATSQVVPITNRVKIAYVLFVPDGNGDQCVIREASGGAPVFKLSASVAKQEDFLDFSAHPVVMEGVYIDTLSASCVVILYTTSGGAI